MKKQGRAAGIPPASERHSNADLFLWALSLVGGSEDYVDIEDVYMKCFDLAPKRFGWRTRPKIPDLQKISVARRDVVKKQNAAGIELISAYEVNVAAGKPVPSYRWRLTNAGKDWVDRWQEHLEGLYGGGNVPTPAQRPDPARLRQIRNSGPFQAWQKNGKVCSEVWELADMLECSPSSSRQIWAHRLDRMESVARADEDSEVSAFIASVRISMIEREKE